jgi:hypothetical protein
VLQENIQKIANPLPYKSVTKIFLVIDRTTDKVSNSRSRWSKRLYLSCHCRGVWPSFIHVPPHNLRRIHLAFKNTFSLCSEQITLYKRFTQHIVYNTCRHKHGNITSLWYRTFPALTISEDL